MKFSLARYEVICVCSALLLSGSFYTQAQESFEPPAVPSEFRAIEITGPMTLDGRLTEADWQRAEPVTDFFRMEPRQGGKYLYETSLRVLFDKKNIYFGIFANDSLGRKGIRVQDYRRDFEYGENDVFYLQLDPQNLKRYCVSFLWGVRTHVTDSGYYAEFTIPFKSLRYNKQTSDSVRRDRVEPLEMKLFISQGYL